MEKLNFSGNNKISNSTFNVRDHVSQPYITTNNIIVLYTTTTNNNNDDNNNNNNNNNNNKRQLFRVKPKMREK